MYILPTAKQEFLKSGHVVLDVGTGRLTTKLLLMTHASATYKSIKRGLVGRHKGKQETKKVKVVFRDSTTTLCSSDLYNITAFMLKERQKYSHTTDSSLQVLSLKRTITNAQTRQF
jgi:hypothetical protein